MLAVRAFVLIIGLLPIAAMAQTPRTLEVILFPGASSQWPFWAGEAQGFFAKNGVAPHITPTPGSVFQMTNLIDGKFDIGMTAIDNVIAYDEGQGEAPVSHKPDLFAFVGGDSGFLHLVAVPEVKSYQDLKGKALGVDARTTGFAFVLEKMLQKNGLNPGDYTLDAVGGTVQRYQDLLAKKHAAALLNTPFELFAKAKGLTILGDAAPVLGHYQSTVGATRRAWAKEHRAELVGFIRGYIESTEWLRNPANRDAAIALLVKNTPNLPPDMAPQIAKVILDPKTGYFPKARIDMAGVRTVIALRSEYAVPKKKLGKPGRYIDLSYYKEALRTMR
jgi:ABC-type nitrate/sulfonate/bicarbonate transport system substrate-binding protein